MRARALALVLVGAAACSASQPDAPATPAIGATTDAGASDGASTPDGGDASVDVPGLEPGEADAVGAATSRVFDTRAFDQPAGTMTGAERSTWIAGQATFQLVWTAAPNTDRSGLGPTFNAAACETCHVKNGRGKPPLTTNDVFVTTLLRLSRPGASAVGGPLGDETYGDQLQTLGIAGVPAEGAARLSFTSEAGAYGDGTPFTKLRPRVEVATALGPLPPDTLLSPRVAQQTVGMGFLDAIADADLLAREDPDDTNGDGISGRANRVWDIARGEAAVGRFGWKASQPTVAQQSASAFSGDLGITSALFPETNCPPAQTACAGAVSAPEELGASRLASVTLFMRGTSVPARRDAGSPDVLNGKALFHGLGCASCHVPSHTTSVTAMPAFLAGVKIWPYTDLLVHDMGDDLADGRPDFTASGHEWRTPPLWGLGLLEVVSGHERLLHDGRARGIEEAILWHGGEAAPAAERFRTAPAADRARLLAFLRSL